MIWANKRSAYDPVRDKDYAAFVRLDYKHWSYFKAIFTHWFSVPRFVIGWLSFMVLGLIACIMCIGYDPKHLPEWRARTIRKGADFVALFICLCASIYPQTKRVDYDYTKYLGPDYKKTYDGAGIHICNHISGFDAMIHWICHYPQCSMLGKREGEKMPGGRQLVGPMGHLLVGRDKRDSKDSRDQLLADIKER